MLAAGDALGRKAMGAANRQGIILLARLEKVMDLAPPAGPLSGARAGAGRMALGHPP